MQYHLNPKSSNSKTGPIPTSTVSKDSCPDVCPFKSRGCYAENYPLKGIWDKINRREQGGDIKHFAAAIRGIPKGQIWRMGQAGDLPGHGNRINQKHLAAIVGANRGKMGFGYTHKPVLDGQDKPKQIEINRAAIAAANKKGFVINLSGNNLAHADQLANLGIGPVITVLPSDATKNTVTPEGRKVIVCPATQREGVTCSTCKLCARGSRSVIVGFPAHGTSKRKVDEVVKTFGVATYKHLTLGKTVIL